MNDLAIRTEQLRREFRGRRALDDVSFEVPAGTIFGYLGPNGAGKTTTIRILLGLIEPTGGRAEVLGFDTRTQADQIRSRCGALLDQPGLYDRLTAEENLDFYGRIFRLPAAERAARCHELLARFGLWDRRKEKVGRWSRGMRQKLAIARALLHRPRLLFLDEPTTGLDALAAATLRQEILALARDEGVTVFLTTHNLAEAEQLCGRVAIIDRGRILASGSPAELRARARAARLEIVGRGLTPETVGLLRARPEVLTARLGPGSLHIELRNGADAAPLIALVVQGGGQIEEVRRTGASLEQVFLSLMETEP